MICVNLQNESQWFRLFGELCIYRFQEYFWLFFEDGQQPQNVDIFNIKDFLNSLCPYVLPEQNVLHIEMQLQKVFTVQKISAAFHDNFIFIAQEITNHLNGLVIKILHEKGNIWKGKLELISENQIEKI